MAQIDIPGNEAGDGTTKTPQSLCPLYITSYHQTQSNLHAILPGLNSNFKSNYYFSKVMLI